MLTTLQHYYNWRKTLQRWLEAYRSKFVEVRNAELCSQAEKLWDRKGARIEHVIKKDLRQAWFEVILRILVLNCLYFMNMLVLLLWDKWFLRYRHIGVGYTLFWTTLYLLILNLLLFRLFWQQMNILMLKLVYFLCNIFFKKPVTYKSSIITCVKM